MNAILNKWRNDKLKTTLSIFWQLTVFFSFFGSAVELMILPGIGVLYPFRLLLPITAVLYLIWKIRERQNPWKGASFTQRVCYVLCALLTVHGGLSLFWAVDFDASFRLFFNLSFDLALFFLMLELCRERKMFLDTIHCILFSLLIQIVLGIIEVFFGGFFHPLYGSFRGFSLDRIGFQPPIVTGGNQNDYTMMLIFGVAMLLIYWAWRRHTEKCDWIPVVLLAPSYLLIWAGEARLCWLCFWFLFVGFVCYAFTLEKKKRWVLTVTVILVLLTVLGSHYERILTEVEALLTPVAAQGTETVMPEATVDSLETKQNALISAFEELKNEIFLIDEETGKIVLNRSLSGGNRMALMLHAWDCFVESYGMGIGLGNTEQLTSRNWLMVWDIHCFLARMIADFGIWFLIPVCLIAFKMLQFGFERFRYGLKKCDRSNTMLGVLYLIAVVIYPIASCSPGDAQDALIMWLFLAAMVLFPVHIQETEQL